MTKIQDHESKCEKVDLSSALYFLKRNLLFFHHGREEICHNRRDQLVLEMSHFTCGKLVLFLRSSCVGLVVKFVSHSEFDARRKNMLFFETYVQSSGPHTQKKQHDVGIHFPAVYNATPTKK